MSTNRLTYIEPKDKFKMVSMDVIMKFEPTIVGIYCKMITLSSGKSLNLDWIVKKMGVGREKVRKAIIFLEEKGYITRYPIRDEKGYISGWNYLVFPEPVKEKDRTHIGRKEDKNTPEKTQPTQNPTSVKPTRLEKGRDISINNNITTNSIDNNSNINVPVNKDGVKCVPEGTPTTPDDVETKYLEGMRRRFPRIMKMSEPLTLEQAKKLKAKFDEKLLLKIMTDMDNWKPLTSKNVSAYKTIIKWCEKEIERV